MSFKPTVLIVEDEQIVAAAMSFALKKFMLVHPSMASSVEGALEALHGTTFDLAVIDYNLGGQTCHQVVTELAKADTPYILVSGSISERSTALPTSPIDYLPKPYTPASLKVAVTKALREKYPDWERLIR